MMTCADYRKDLIGDVIEKWASAAPEHAAVRWTEGGQLIEKTYGTLQSDIKACAERYLSSYHNRRVALCGKQDYRFLVLLLAVIQSGNSAAVVTDFAGNPENREILESIRTAAYFTYDGSDIRACEDPRFVSGRAEPQPGNDREAVVLLTSGMTGRKKCVSLSHRNLLFDAHAICKMIAFDLPVERRLIYGFLPFSHAFSLQANILCPLYVGGTVCLGTNPARFSEELALLRPEFCIAVPQMIKGILGRLRAAHIEKIDTFPTVFCGGAGLSADATAIMAAHGVNVLQGYGTTECSPIISINPPSDNRFGSAGKVLEGMDVRILNNEILVKGDNVFRGYVNDDAAASEVFIDGYYRTGDTGYTDKDGYLYLTGRIKTTIILPTGENISPDALEEKLMSSPDIEDAYVHESTGGAMGCVAAAVYSASAPEKVIETVLEFNRVVEPYERIRLLEFTEAPLERTELGKIRRLQHYQVIRRERIS